MKVAQGQTLIYQVESVEVGDNILSELNDLLVRMRDLVLISLQKMKQ